MADWKFQYVIILGLIHGVNPLMGWLFSLLTALLRKRKTQCVLSSLWISLGHVASIPPIIIGMSFLHSIAREIAMPVFALASISWGLLLVVRPPAHKYLGFRIGPPLLALWGFFMGTLHGAGLAFAPIIAFANNHSTPSLTVLVLAHFIALLASMSIASITAYTIYVRVGAGFLAKLVRNYNIAWPLLLLAIGLTLLWAYLRG